MSAKSEGLADVVAGRTAICNIGVNGEGLHYRGYSVEDLASQAEFEEVAYLLLFGHLPSTVELARFKIQLIAGRLLPDALRLVLEQIPATAHPMDVLRTGCSMLGTIEPENKDNPGLEISIRLIAAFPAILLYWYHFSRSGRRIPTELSNEGTANYFLQMLHQRTPD